MSEKIISKNVSHGSFDDAANAALFMAVFIGVWQIVFMLGIWPKISLPSPYMVAESFVKIIWNHSLPVSIGVTLARLVAAFAISIALGTLIGLVMIKFKVFGKMLSS